MNLKDSKYGKFALVREMLETPAIIRRFDYNQASEALKAIEETGKLFLTGEGSSRIFPAKNMRAEMMKLGAPVSIGTEGARQAHEYDLSGFTVLGASNSGKTKEIISLFTRLKEKGHSRRFGLTAAKGSNLEALAT